MMYGGVMSADNFFRRSPNGETACGDTGYFLRLRTGRDGDTLYLRHETKEISRNADRKSRIICFCSSATRPTTEEEVSQIGADQCRNVVLRAVSWSEDWNLNEIEGLGNTREFLTRFFHYYQLVMGIGCYVNGEPRNALVEVTFGTAWYGINH